MADLSYILFGSLFGVLASLLIILFFNNKRDEKQDRSILELERRITDLMQRNLNEIRGNVDNTSRNMNRQISAFTRETTNMRHELQKVQETVAGISSFQEIFKSPKLRGEWGEASLENILSQYYPKELYETQYLFSSGKQVDAILKLPNNRILPIDAKFASDNFLKMREGENEDYYRKQFNADLKKQIDEIASKYILPSEGTVDYAIMYVPAEAIYYEIITNQGQKFDLDAYARKQKVIVVSPNTIYLVLKTIEHWFKDSQLSQHTQRIIRRLETVQGDAVKLADSFRKLGNHLNNAHSAFNDSEKRLSLLTDRTERIIKEGGEKKLKGKKG